MTPVAGRCSVRNGCRLGALRVQFWTHVRPKEGRTWGTAGLWDTWATIYNRVGVVKRHLGRRRFLSFPFVESFCFCSCCRSCLALIAPRLALRILRWKFGSTNHLSGHSSSDHDSLFELPGPSGKARRPISPTMSYFSTRVAHGLPCMRTSCA